MRKWYHFILFAKVRTRIAASCCDRYLLTRFLLFLSPDYRVRLGASIHLATDSPFPLSLATNGRNATSSRILCLVAWIHSDFQSPLSRTLIKVFAFFDGASTMDLESRPSLFSGSHRWSLLNGDSIRGEYSGLSKDGKSVVVLDVQRCLRSHSWFYCGYRRTRKLGKWS